MHAWEGVLTGQQKQNVCKRDMKNAGIDNKVVKTDQYEKH